MSNNPPYMDHRWGTRVELFTPVDVATATGRSFNAVLRDASLSGGLIKTLWRQPVLSRVQLKPHAPGFDWMKACVVRTDSQGFGGFAVEWLEPALRSVSALLALRDAAPEFDESPRVQRGSASRHLLEYLQWTPTGT
jgi:hypothetical protein